MKNQILIKRYTQGLVNSIKNEAEYSALKGELSDFTTLLSSHKQLNEILSRPFLPRSKKAQIIKDILAEENFSEKMTRFLKILIEHNRLDLLSDILNFLPLLWNEKQGIFAYEIVSAVPLNEIQKKRLEQKLESFEKRPVFLKYKVDPELLGGFFLKKGSTIYDISLKGQLARLKEKIIEG